MYEIPKNDLMFLQNEILGDIKKVENKLESKIFKLSESLDDQKSTYEKKYIHLESLFNILKQKTQNLKSNDSSEKETTTKINSLDKKIDQYYSRLESKIILLQKNLQDSNYKIDKAILNANQVPGLIGDRCPYVSMREFYESTHKKINESLRNKEQQSMDLKKYKEKMDAVITKNNTQLPLFENKITNYFDSQIRDIDNKFKERIDIIEERMNGLRIENGKHSTNLIEKCNELNEKYENIDNTIKNSIEKYNEEITEFINSFKNMNNDIKHFEEKYNLFKEKFNMLNKLDDNVKQIKNNFNKLDNKINEISNKIITSKKEESDFEENKNKSIIINKNNNNIIYKLQNEEMEINSLINSKQNKNKENISLKKLNIKNNNINVGLRKINYKTNYLDLVKNYQKKKENFYDESYEYTKINNIVFDADFFRRSNYLGNSYSNDYYNQNYRIKKPQKLLYRIKSCKYTNKLNHLSINENNMKDEQSSININNNINNGNHNSLENDLYDKEDYDNRKELLITSNLWKKYDLEPSETYYPPSHKFLYLDKKIDILSNVMVDSINKLIYQINYLKKQNLNINASEGKEENMKNSPLKKRQFFRSPSYIGKSNFKKVYSEKRRKLSQRFNIVSKDNDNKKVVN